MEAFSAQSNHAGDTSRRPHRATVTTTARLHFGFLDPSGRGPRPFGSFGLALDRPGTRLTLERAERLAVTGPERMRAARYLKTIAESCAVDRAYDLNIAEAIPPHAGLGSGTQLALAVGSAFAALEEHFADAMSDDLDGLRLDWPDKWLLIRASNTEPIVRIIAEAEDEAEARRLCDSAIAVVSRVT